MSKPKQGAQVPSLWFIRVGGPSFVHVYRTAAQVMSLGLAPMAGGRVYVAISRRTAEPLTIKWRLCSLPLGWTRAVIE